MKIINIWKVNTLAAAIIAGGIALPTIATAAEKTATVEEVVVLGSRGAPRSVGESPVPVDVIGSEELGKAGSNDLLMQLQGTDFALLHGWEEVISERQMRGYCRE